MKPKAKASTPTEIRLEKARSHELIGGRYMKFNS
jgi:hypothetical protein